MSDFRAIPKSPSIPEIVLEEIQRLIAEGKVRPGDHLPSETELAERFGVGRSSIREAMRVLQLIGVVEVIQGKGTFVRQAGILPLMIDWSRISQTGLISEAMEARQFMEVLLARLAAERATHDDIEALRRSLRQSEESLSNMESNVRAGVDFHLVLADAAHNQILALMYRTITDLYLEVARRMRITPEMAHDRFHDHERLLEAVASRDPQAAADIMKDHLDKAYQILSAGEPETKSA
ncbi:MAG: FadR family transcriptional regulator [Chloroflexi bacterium]|nr:FadR family transcriptional regulator [Chloroflexota bacterium]